MARCGRDARDPMLDVAHWTWLRPVTTLRGAVSTLAMRIFKQTSLCVALLISMGTLINAQTSSQPASAAPNSSAALIEAATQTKASNEALVKAQETQITA